MKRRIVSSPTGPNEVNDNTQNKTYISSSVSATLGFLSQLSSAGLEKVDLNKASEKRPRREEEEKLDSAEIEIVALELVGHGLAGT